MKKVLTVCLIALIAVASVFAQGASETASEAKLQKVRVAYMPNYASLCSRSEEHTSELQSRI